MIKDAENTNLLILEGDVGLYTEILRIDEGETSDTLIFGFPDGDTFWGGDIDVNPIHTELEEGSLFSAYVKNSDGNTVESFEDEPLIFECIEYYDPWGESLGNCSNSIWLKSCMGVAVSTVLAFLI